MSDDAGMAADRGEESDGGEGRVGDAGDPAVGKPDPIVAQIAARFARFDIAKGCGGYTLPDRRTSNPAARLKTIPGTGGFGLLYRSNVRECWRTFGNFGRIEPTLEEAHDIVQTDPIFRLSGHR